MEVCPASIGIHVCHEGHVHLRQTAHDDDECPVLDTSLSAEDAREFALAVLAAAKDVSPVQ
jgi:hypothetical protein